ncbi:MAG: DUF3887 domain-containing protein [Chlorobi bacterium]|nr:DUF3887 domain-containing protein [Chlorobiota bacterium]
MKSLVFILGVYFIFSLNSCSQDFKKLDNTELDKIKLQIAQNFAVNYLTKLREGSFYEFHDEAIDALKSQLTEQNQKLIYHQLSDKFGDFKSLEYAETWIQGNNNSILIFRFKSNFEKSKKKLEVRVVLNESGKIAGFWIKPWSDMLK